MYIKRCPPPFSTAYNSRVNKSLCFWLYHFHHQCQWLISMSFSKSSILSSFHFQASLVMSAQINIRIEGCSFSQSHTCPDVQIYCRHKRWNLRQPWRINHTHSPLKCCSGSQQCGCWQRHQPQSYSVFKLCPFFCSRSFLLCRYPVRCRRFIVAPRKITMLVGTSLVVTQPWIHN